MIYHSLVSELNLSYMAGQRINIGRKKELSSKKCIGFQGLQLFSIIQNILMFSGKMERTKVQRTFAVQIRFDAKQMIT